MRVENDKLLTGTLLGCWLVHIVIILCVVVKNSKTQKTTDSVFKGSSVMLLCHYVCYKLSSITILIGLSIRIYYLGILQNLKYTTK